MIAASDTSAEGNEALPYDPSDAHSIVEYAQILVGSTLREQTGATAIDNPARRKGSFGNAVEYYYFKYDPNSDSNPDFAQAGIELKTTPLKQNSKGKLVSKERLVICMINYMSVIDETFETSHLLDKASNILLISYLYEKDKDPLDYEVKIATLWKLPEEDMPIFKKDWETIVGKIREGKAHEISSSDTLYLEACTKAANSTVKRPQPFSNIPAKPRAWALKASYMTTISNTLLEKMQPIKRSQEEKETALLDLVRNRFEPFFGQTENDLAQTFGYDSRPGKKPKNLCALITKKILGVDADSKIEEFEKAGIKPKTMRLKRNSIPKESISFPSFDYNELVDTPFENSDFKEQLDSKYLFVIYREDPLEKDVYRLRDVMFWQMPENDLDEAKRCYDEMSRRTRQGHAENSVKSSENRCCHVRPHGRNKNDTRMTPYGVPVVKKCFWLNAQYLAEEIKRSGRF